MFYKSDRYRCKRMPGSVKTYIGLRAVFMVTMVMKLLLLPGGAHPLAGDSPKVSHL